MVFSSHVIKVRYFPTIGNY